MSDFNEHRIVNRAFVSTAISKITKRRRAAVFTAAAATLSMFGLADAAKAQVSYTWISTAGTSWSNTSAWSGGTAPTVGGSADTTVIFDQPGYGDGSVEAGPITTMDSLASGGAFTLNSVQFNAGYRNGYTTPTIVATNALSFVASSAGVNPSILFSEDRQGMALEIAAPIYINGSGGVYQPTENTNSTSVQTFTIENDGYGGNPGDYNVQHLTIDGPIYASNLAGGIVIGFAHNANGAGNGWGANYSYYRYTWEGQAKVIFAGAASNNTYNGGAFSQIISISGGSFAAFNHFDQAALNSIALGGSSYDPGTWGFNVLPGGVLAINSATGVASALTIGSNLSNVWIGANGSQTLSAALTNNNTYNGTFSTAVSYNFGGQMNWLNRLPDGMSSSNFGQFRQGFTLLSGQLTVNSYLADGAGAAASVIIGGGVQDTSGFVSGGVVVLGNATNSFSGGVIVTNGGYLLQNGGPGSLGTAQNVSVQGGMFVLGGSSAYVGTATIGLQQGSFGANGGNTPSILEIDNTGNWGAGNPTALANATIDIAGGLIAQDNNQGTGQVNTIGNVNIYGGGKILLNGSSTSVKTGLTINNLNLDSGATLLITAQTTTNATDLGSAFSQLKINNLNGVALANYGPNMIDPHIVQYGYGQFLTVGANGLQPATFDQTLNGLTTFASVANAPTQIVNLNFTPSGTYSPALSTLDSDINVAALRIGMAVNVKPDTGYGNYTHNSITVTNGAGSNINIGTNYAHAAGLIIQVSTANGYRGSQVNIYPNLNFGSNEAVITVIDTGWNSSDSSGKNASSTAANPPFQYASLDSTFLWGNFSAGSLTKAGNSALYMRSNFTTPLSSVVVSEGTLTIGGGPVIPGNYGPIDSPNPSFLTAVQNASLKVAAGAKFLTNYYSFGYSASPAGQKRGFLSFGGLGYIQSFIQLRNDVPTTISPGMGFSNTAGTAHPGVLTFNGDPGASTNTTFLFDLGRPNVNISAATSDEIYQTNPSGYSLFTLGGSLKVNPLAGFGPGNYTLVFSESGFQYPGGYASTDYSGSNSVMLTSPGSYLPSTYSGYNLSYSTAVNGDEFDLIVTGVASNNLGQWASTTGGTWSVSSNWASTGPLGRPSSGIPGILGDTATFGTNLTSSAIVTLDSSRTVSDLIFNNAVASYTIAASGTAVLTVDGGANAGLIGVINGQHTITAPLNLGSSGVNVNFSNSSAALTVGTISGTGVGTAGPLSISGPGALSVTGNMTLGVVNLYGTTPANATTLSLPDSGSPIAGSINTLNVAGSSSGGSGLATLSVGYNAPVTINSALNVVAGGSLSITTNDGYFGQVNVNGTSSTGTGAVIVTNGATLAGGGLIPGSVTIASGSILAPGSSAASGTSLTNLGTLHMGNLALTGGSTLNFSLGLGAGSSTAGISSSGSVSGTLSLISTSLGSVTIDLFQDPSAGTLAAGNFYQLLTFASTSGFTGTNGFTLDDMTGSGLNFSLSNTGSALDLLLGTLGSSLTNSQWASSVGGIWGVSGNWTAGIPALPGDIATFGTNLASSDTVYLETSRSLGQINFNNSAASYTIATTNGSTLTLSAGTLTANVNVINGTHAITAPLAITSYGANFNFSNGAGLTVGTIGGSATANAPLAISGSGTLTVSAGNVLPSNVSLSIANNATVVLAINHGVNAGLLSTLNGLSMSGSSTLDLGNNNLILNYSGTNSPLVAIANLVSSAQSDNQGGLSGNRTWTGTGITSTYSQSVNAAQGRPALMGIGYQEASFVASKGYTSWNGEPISTTSTAVLVMPTLIGDITMQGVVNADDLGIFAANYGQDTSLGWSVGDFFNEGAVNADSLGAFAANYGYSLAGFPAVTPAEYAQGEALLASIGTDSFRSVPEPASLSLLGLGAGALLARRRRSRR